ncbi:MAG: hypothetical protein LC798_13045 [Chloroflexi bacterium]|nr:hypothetical protein [Chloroflexota bacterium]
MTVRPHRAGVRGQVFLMADPWRGHPEVPTVQPVAEAEHVALIVHPDDEERVRDLVAVAQETPRWWLDLQRFQRVLNVALASPGEGE